MRRKVIENVINNWDKAFVWKENEKKQLIELLKEVAVYNGANIIWDIEKDIALEDFHVEECLRAAIQSELSYYLHQIFKFNDSLFYSTPLDEKDKGEVVRCTYTPKVDLNTATALELKNLPGIGPVTAQRIIEYRNKHRIRKCEEMFRIKGINADAYASFVNLVYVETDTRYSFLSKNELEFIDSPTFENFIKLVKDKHYILNHNIFYSDQESTEQKLLYFIQRIRDNLEGSPFRKRRQIGIRASRLKSRYEQLDNAKKIADKFQDEKSNGVLLSNTGYLHFIKKILEQSKIRIYVAMFFLRFTNDEKYPTYPLIKEIEKAHERGVDVRIVIDKDREEDPYQSSQINKDVYEHLKAKKIPVRFDTPERGLHSKIVIIDDDITVTGSHNWTAGSFYQYDDKSVYIESQSTNRFYQEWFIELWKALD